jgi:glucose/arabinose dehydrogenase
MFRFLVGERHLKHDPTENLENPKVWTSLPKSLQADEVEALLRAPDRETPHVLRDRAMLELLYATGLRNPVGLDFRPGTGELYTVVNERDELGSDLVPDYLTRVRDGAFYGWPWSYYGQRVDTRVEPARPDMVARAIPPDFALGSHVAPLGLAFADGARLLGPDYAGGAFIGEHGSWNRRPFSGYRVVFVPFAGGRPRGQPVDVLSGFLAGDKAMGRPVGVAVAGDGALLVADDVGGMVWRVSRS